jgi:competence protein comEA helix-hairpin-helix repeat region
VNFYGIFELIAREGVLSVPLANFIIGVYMKSLKSLLSVTALTLAISGSALANENPLATLKDVAKDNVKTTVSENVKSVKDSASAEKGNVLEKVSSTKEKATEGVSSMKEKMAAAKEKVDSVKDKAKSLKDSSSEDSHKALKHKAAEKVKETKEKAAEKMNSAKDNVKSVVDSAKININKADAKTLQQLSGIGEKKAQAIIDYRNKVGKIKDMAELSKIDGLGSTTIEKIAPFLSF